MTAALDLGRMRSTRDALRLALDRLNDPRRARCAELLAPDLSCRGDAALNLGGATLPRLRSPDSLTESITVRAAAATLADLDSLAEALTARGDGAGFPGGRIGRLAVARMALPLGLAALRRDLEGAPEVPEAGPDLANAGEGLRPIPVLTGAREHGEPVLTGARVPGESVLTGAPDPRQPALPLDRTPEAFDPEDLRNGPPTRRAPPRRGGRRPVDPVERRGPDRLDVADLGAWVQPTGPDVTHKQAAHVLTDLGAGGVAGFACGKGEALAILCRADEGRRRCAECQRRTAAKGEGHA